LITRIENKAKIKFKKIGAPQRNDIIESSIRDIKTAISTIDESMVTLFKKSAEELIEEFGAEKSVARLFAYISGHTEKMKSRSLLCGAEGFITYTIKFNSAFNHMGYVWGFFKRICPEDVKAKIRGMRVYKDMTGCVFDYAEDSYKQFEEIIFNDRMYGVNYTLEKIDELPDLQENTDSGAPMRNEFRGGHGSYNGNGRSYSSGHGQNGHARPVNSFVKGNRSGDREGRTDIFIGNLNYNSTEGEFKRWLDQNKIDTGDLDIRFAVDRETRQPKGFGFVSVYDNDKKRQILNLNGSTFASKSLKINESNSK
jgi:ATP-dependent RNA helicase DDX21